MPTCRCEPARGRLNLETRTSQNQPISARYLAHHPELADELARWAWTEWRVFFDARGRTCDDARRSYGERAQIGALPLALVAFAGGKLVGTVSLMVHDLPTRPELTPWLASLFVVPDFRRRGVASLLIERAVVEAARLKLPTLYLWTSSAEAEALYRKVGWRSVERTEYCGKEIVIMQIEGPRAWR